MTKPPNPTSCTTNRQFFNAFQTFFRSQDQPIPFLVEVRVGEGDVFFSDPGRIALLDVI